VRGSSCDSPRDRHSSGPGITARLGATYPPALRAASTLAYLVLLRVEIARFTRAECGSARVAMRIDAFASPTMLPHRGSGLAPVRTEHPNRTRSDSSLLL